MQALKNTNLNKKICKYQIFL